MTVSSAIKYRTLFILVATFWVLCFSPLADIHFEGNFKENSYVHRREPIETSVLMLIHELLFTHLQHTLDHVTLGFSHRALKANKSISSKGTVSTSYPQIVCSSNPRASTAHLTSSIAFLHDHKRASGMFSREYSGLSPPTSLLPIFNSC